MFTKGKYYQAYDNEIWLHTSYRLGNEKDWGANPPKLNYFICKASPLMRNRFFRDWVKSHDDPTKPLQIQTVMLHQWETKKALKFLKGALKQLAME